MTIAKSHSLKFHCVKKVIAKKKFVIYFHINVHLINFRIAHTKILPHRHDIIVKEKDLCFIILIYFYILCLSLTHSLARSHIFFFSTHFIFFIYLFNLCLDDDAFTAAANLLRIAYEALPTLYFFKKVKCILADYLFCGPCICFASSHYQLS